MKLAYLFMNQMSTNLVPPLPLLFIVYNESLNLLYTFFIKKSIFRLCIMNITFYLKILFIYCRIEVDADKC